MSISQAPRAIASKNIDLIGYNDLKERPAFKIAMQEVNGRFYLYLSHFWVSGWSVIDVTEPDKPEYLNFIEVPENTWTLQVQVAEGILRNFIFEPLAEASTSPKINPIIPPRIISNTLVPMP